MAAIDYFLKLDGITGESADSKHKGEIEVLSFSFAETQVGPIGDRRRRRRRQGRDERLLLHGAHEQGLAAALPCTARRASTSSRRS